MHHESIRCQIVQVLAAGLELDFRNGDTIHTENSYKFTDETLRGLLSDSGFQIETTRKDAPLVRTNAQPQMRTKQMRLRLRSTSTEWSSNAHKTPETTLEEAGDQSYPAPRQ